MSNINQFKSLLHKLIKEELEGGEEEKPQGLEKINYDLVLEPANLQSALSALGDIKNYGIYANNLRDPKIITKIFGPSIPAQKANTAWRTWDTLNDEEKIAKASDIRNRVPDAWKQVEADLQDKFEEWMATEGEGSFLEFISTLNSTELRNIKSNGFFGSRGANYYPMKTPDNLKKYSGVMAKDKDYVVDGDKIVFPQKTNPFETKDYLTKVLKTIMGNAKVAYSISQREADDQPQTSSNTQGAVDKINFVKTFDSPELARKFMKLIPKDFAPKTDLTDTKITVSDITDPQKKNLMATALKFIADNEPKKKPVKENITPYFKPSIIKSEAPNFLTIVIKYPEGSGFTTALGQRTISGQEREEGAAKALKIGQAIASKLESKYNIEDIDVSDNKNGTVMVFAVSDDFINLPKPSLDEGMSDDEWKAAKEADRLEAHPEKDKIKKIQALMRKEKNSSEKLKETIAVLIKEMLSEKKLTAAEKNKKEDIVKAMAKQGAPKDSKTYAIATAKAKKLAENEEDVVDTITMDVPLFIRMLEYAREDASTDMDLHDVAENAISLNKGKEYLSMEDYNQIIGTTE